jgi:purine-binding chemotaxis protein CheW
MTTAEDIAQVLIIGLGQEIFALPATLVRDILEVGDITPLPTAPAFVGHLVNVRGRVVPLADLSLCFGMPKAAVTVDTRMIVLEVIIDHDPTLVAVLADKVHEVTQLDVVVAKEVPKIGTRWRPEFARAIGKRHSTFVMVLDVDRIFSPDDRDLTVSL